jgi:hypothetical protein
VIRQLRPRRREPEPPVRGAVSAASATTAARQMYVDGLSDGVASVLDQLDGRGALAPDGIYAGPMPRELVSWIADVRRRLAEQRAGGAS